jgi:ubiquinone/menaquinone biosynthesis C-methylase UbiE
MTGSRAADLDSHYGRADLGDAIVAGLRASGKDPDRLAVEDLAPIDQFHIMGREATLDLARRAGLAAGALVLDVGGGLGGAARLLAHDFGARVTVLDYTATYCQVGADLTRRTGLQDLVRFEHGSALDIPSGEGRFDLVWTQHSSMNIEDKGRLYAEIRRVLRPGGRLALHEVMAGPNQPVHFPVPWARDPRLSFLRAPAEVRELLRVEGFTELEWHDLSGPSLGWFRDRLAAAPVTSTPPPLGLHLLLGADFQAMFLNQVRNLQEDRIAVVMAVLQR